MKTDKLYAGPCIVCGKPTNYVLIRNGDIILICKHGCSVKDINED